MDPEGSVENPGQACDRARIGHRCVEDARIRETVNMSRSLWLAFGILLVFAPASAVAEDATPVTLDDAAVKADTAWVLVCSALVLMMTAPGLALFYGGLVRKKNVLSVLMQCAALIGLMSVVWVVCGYSFAFGSSVLGGFIGGTDYLLLDGVLAEWTDGIQVVPMAGSLPRSVHMVFQMMFFIITPALICGAFAERMKFSAMCVFSVLWGLLVYCPLAHWVWADDGWLSVANSEATFPLLDFAGGAVVHLSSSVAALVCCIVMGPRVGFAREAMPPHNLTYTAIGAALLWVGWFGFNAGSALAADGAAGMAMLVTQVSTATAALTWMAIEWFKHGKPSVLGIITGAVAGLVAITPASGFVGPMGAIAIGFVSGFVCFYGSTSLKQNLGYDDSLDVFGVHGIGGIVGCILTGIFVSEGLGGQGLAAGVTIGQQVVAQVLSLLVTIIYSGVLSFIILKIVDAIVGLRVDEDQEQEGLDLALHSERGYDL